MKRRILEILKEHNGRCQDELLVRLLMDSMDIKLVDFIYGFREMSLFGGSYLKVIEGLILKKKIAMKIDFNHLGIVESRTICLMREEGINEE